MNPRLKNIIESLDSLPALPSTAVRIIDVSNKESYHLSEIVSIIENDPAVATRVLRVANSPFYGFLGRVASIDHAVALLGISELKNIVLASALSIYFGNGKQEGSGSFQNLWEHSVLTAFVARMLGEEFYEPDVSSLFLVGLIHDIGYAIVRKKLPEEYERLMTQAKDRQVETRSLEKEIVGASHSEIGALALKNWRLPARVVIPVLYHHAPWKDSNYPLVSTIIHFADTLSRILGYYPNEVEGSYGVEAFLNSPGAAMVTKAGYILSDQTMSRLLRRIDQHLASTGDLSVLFSS